MSQLRVSPWQVKIYRLYLVSFIAWAVAEAALLAYFFAKGMPGDTYLSAPLSGLMQMLLALPGLAYFFWQSRKLRGQTGDDANATMERIMVLQQITGVVAVAGGFLGGLPFLVNFVGILSMAPGDMWNNLGMILPWVSLYGFIATSVIAIRINRRRKKQG